VSAVPATQRFIEQQVPAPHTPLPTMPQAAVQEKFVQVGVAPEQGKQGPPEPQAALLVPGWQAPPAQQPPLQGEWLPSPQTFSQRFVVRLQAVPAGQSLAMVQPQVPETQREPTGFAVQSTQAPPGAPQAFDEPPASQLPVTMPPGTEQQPPLQENEALQLSVHICMLVSQAVRSGQSAVVLQPQVWAGVQTWPRAAREQSKQMLPSRPQAALSVPGRQVPVVAPEGIEQQPERQGEAMLHEMTHA